MICNTFRHTSYNLRRKVSAFVDFFQQPPLRLALAPEVSQSSLNNGLLSSTTTNPSLADCLWLAVPKRKVSRSKKRMKTTVQKRIKDKEHIIVDSRTGEYTLRHRLPFNWKEYLP
mmetsp:Transcript_9236/g.11644  ORF Transcript_9236/g.11644 Transcript_9236/m.11644 type:complete len:115 (-) Transcript_9236:3223-3567(-)